MQVLHWLRVNVFKVVVMLGTFALAMAFAGNDLVNFIGVPLAGYSSYVDYMANGAGQRHLPHGVAERSGEDAVRIPLRRGCGDDHIALHLEEGA